MRVATAPIVTGLNRASRIPGVISTWLGRLPASVPQLVLRLTMAIPFWHSGLTKFDGFLQPSPGAVWLFTNDFRLHILGGTYAYPFPALMATLSGIGELVFPVMLVLGLGTRLAAAGMLAMTAIIQLTIPDAWQAYHLPWAAMLLAIIAHGPGRISLDAVVASRLMRSA
ncbi:DoxX family protein [Arhodomonas aquaeolei]|uniref:DoxX family protein n=1 Tax=Arhodomonas aquaeolei TaxID=2369 RepID=UPI00035DD25C|nr:DoxX family protein [Arhodomonas aquaeolei]